MKKQKIEQKTTLQDEKSLYNLIGSIKKRYCSQNYNNCVHCPFNYYGTCLATEMIDSLEFIIGKDSKV